MAALIFPWDVRQSLFLMLAKLEEVKMDMKHVDGMARNVLIKIVWLLLNFIHQLKNVKNIYQNVFLMFIIQIVYLYMKVVWNYQKIVKVAYLLIIVKLRNRITQIVFGIQLIINALIKLVNQLNFLMLILQLIIVKII